VSWHVSPWVYPVWDSLCLWDNIKHTNIQIIGVQEEEEEKKGMRKFLRDYS